MNETEEGPQIIVTSFVSGTSICEREKSTDLVAGELDHFLEGKNYEKQMKGNRRIRREQLLGVSKVMEEFC